MNSTCPTCRSQKPAARTYVVVDGEARRCADPFHSPERIAALARERAHDKGCTARAAAVGIVLEANGWINRWGRKRPRWIPYGGKPSVQYPRLGQETMVRRLRRLGHLEIAELLEAVLALL